MYLIMSHSHEQINGTSLVGLPYGEGVNTIRGIKYEGVFTVQRMKESHPQEEVGVAS